MKSEIGDRVCFAIFMLFNLLCLELAFCAAVGGSGASSRRTLQMDCKEFEKMQEMFVPCPCVVGMIALYAPTL